jgi:peptide/nickel transport system permease protein
MARYIATRVLGSIPIVFLVTVVAFSLEHTVPGNPALAIAGNNASVAQVAAISREFGLNRSLPVQYWEWLRHAVVGQFGSSFITGTTVIEGFVRGLPVTLSLIFVALVFAIPVALLMGLFAGRRPGSFWDPLTTVFASLGIAVPGFWLGLIVISLFAVRFHLLPSGGYVGLTASFGGWIEHLVMPGIVLGFPIAGVMALQLRGTVAEAMEARFVRTLRAFGVPERRIVWRHVLREAAPPVLHVSAVQIAYLIGGTAIIEQVFDLPGIGNYVLTAITGRDTPVVQAAVLLFSLVVIVVNLGMDIAHAALTPQVRRSLLGAQ